jgi:hypothetical protein
MDIRLKRAVAVCILAFWSYADAATAFENTAEPIHNTIACSHCSRELDT